MALAQARRSFISALKRHPAAVGIVQLLALPVLCFELVRTVVHLLHDFGGQGWLGVLVVIASLLAIAFILEDMFKRGRDLLDREVLVALVGVLVAMSWVAYVALTGLAVYLAPFPNLPLIYWLVFGAMIPTWFSKQYSELRDGPLPLFSWADERQAKARPRRTPREELAEFRRQNPAEYAMIRLGPRAL